MIMEKGNDVFVRLVLLDEMLADEVFVAIPDVGRVTPVRLLAGLLGVGHGFLLKSEHKSHRAN